MEVCFPRPAQAGILEVVQQEAQALTAERSALEKRLQAAEGEVAALTERLAAAEAEATRQMAERSTAQAALREAQKCTEQLQQRVAHSDEGRSMRPTLSAISVPSAYHVKRYFRPPPRR